MPDAKKFDEFKTNEEVKIDDKKPADLFSFDNFGFNNPVITKTIITK